MTSTPPAPVAYPGDLVSVTTTTAQITGRIVSWEFTAYQDGVVWIAVELDDAVVARPRSRPES